MKHDHFVVQSPDKPAQQLLLLFHGVGDNPVAMGEIGSWFAPLFPDALVVSVGGAEPSGNPAGRQWFSVQGITEDNRQARVDAIMPTFIETVRYWQKQSGVGANATALIGFSQGAIMALESIKAEPGLASRVIAFNGSVYRSGACGCGAGSVNQCRWRCDAGYRGGFRPCDRQSQYAISPGSLALYHSETLFRRSAKRR